MSADTRDEEDQLTEAGWPRPIVNRWPVPWISPRNDLSQMDDERRRRVVADGICQVCGLGHEAGTRVYVCVSEGERPPETTGVRCMDSAVMHERCARLAVARCPQLVELRRIGHLSTLTVPIEAVFRLDDQLCADIDEARDEPELSSVRGP